MRLRIHLALSATAAIAACRAPCDSDFATITGFAVGQGEITVRVYDATTFELVSSTTPDANGQYVLAVPGDRDYVLNATATTGQDTGGGGTTCYTADVAVSPAPCETVTRDLEVPITCDTADKPNLYLYPLRPTPTVVQLRHDPRQEVFASEPPYADAWEGTAYPDGTFAPVGEAPAPFLFYEITLLPGQYTALQHHERFCIPGDGAVRALADLLGAYGFSERERADFVDAWSADLPPASSYAVYPQLAVDDAVQVDITPPMPLHRLWLVLEDGRDCTPTAPAPQALPRHGAHAVEWGVVLHDLR
jgi:hypothetical protein